MPDLNLRAIISLRLAPLIHAAESYDFRITGAEMARIQTLM